ncbi:ABC transporter ATP-binding protein [archaeon]|jgi:putative ABC transport system ATP-binding protein|nr:ABC transporter ATP-binding protein [archaeon]MBT7903630.1 ABC transporter ATP-binding protein [Candidatus Woesearchaeota archaeon]MBT4376020.1 ABC transporter ATP-binding protein [archaeon]MBT4669975.1 ABC transporter ATP-binding protein [archaeon]MBT5287446.1 ABC transporter ATP-binding protein [archaeon]
MNELITIKNLSKTFNKVEAVKDVSFKIKKGEFLGIQGHSGSGKSTLLGLLAGLEKANSGKITYNGSDLTNMNEDELALFRRENVGVVFQSFNLIPTLNIIENIALPLFPLNISKNEMIERARKIAKDVGLSHRLTHYANELSGGEQQRVAIARALINNPKVLFADEPTGNLDSKTGKKIIELLKELNREKELTVVMVTHDNEIAKNSDRIIEMKDGGVIR